MHSISEPAASEGLSTAGLVGLTAGKAVSNVGLRWIPFFLPTLGRALGASTSAMTSVIGFGEIAGLLSAMTGRRLDGGRERTIMTIGLGMVAVSTGLAIVGQFYIFAIAQFLLTLGIALYTVGGHAFISRHVSFERRGRSLGIFETSWAVGLLVGAPVAAILIEIFSWRAPFIAVGLLSLVGTAVLFRVDVSSRAGTVPAAMPARSSARLDINAWLAVAASAGIALAGLTTIVIIGTWLEDQLGVSTGGIGVVAMGFGAVELISSTASATFSDRLGKNRSTRWGLGLLLVGLVVMVNTGTGLAVGVIGMGLFFLGFEYAIVTSFSVVSEAMPGARGRVLAANVAVGTVARGLGSVASGFLYEAAGINGPAILSGAGAVAAIAALTVLARRAGPS